MNSEASPGTTILRFGPYEADPAAAELRKNGIRLKLQEQPFQVLWALLERPGEVVTREELRQRLWADDTFVDFDNGLNTAINKIREALEDSARRPRFVETVPRHGYRWVGPTPSSSEWQHPDPAPRTVPRFAYLAVALMALTLVGGGVWISTVNARRQPVPEQPLRAVPLTSYEGSEVSPSFSPDGNQVAFAWNGPSRENFDIYVQVIGSGAPLPLTSDPADDLAPAWSPDGRYIAFLRPVPGSLNGQAAVYLVSPLGGPEKKLVEGRFLKGLYFPFKISWSPDAKTLFLMEWDGVAYPIYAVGVDSGEKRRLTSPPLEGRDYVPAISPDGETLAFGRHVPAKQSSLYAVPIEGGDPRLLASVGGRTNGVAWLPDSWEIVFAQQTAGLSPSLWRIAADGTSSSRLNILGGEGIMPGVSPDGDRLVFVQSQLVINVWRHELSDRTGDSRRPRKIIASTQLDGAAQISPNGDRIVFSSSRSGSYEIWVAESDGSNQVQLTDIEPHAGSPRWSPDGRTIAFDTWATSGGSTDIYLVAANGGPARRLVIEGDGVVQRPSWSYDGRWVYFAALRTGTRQIWKVPSTGGKPVQVTRQGGDHPFESSDGRFVYYAGPDRTSVRRVPVGGGEEISVVTGLESPHWDRWDLTADGIYFVDEEPETSSGPPWRLKLFRFGTKKVTVVSEIDEPPRSATAVDVSPDGKWFVYGRADRSDSDLMLVENFE